MKRYEDEAFEADDGAELNIDLLGIVRRRFHLIMLGLLVGSTCATIFFVKQKPVYQSSLAVLVGQLSTKVAATGVRDASDGAVTMQEEILSTHVELFGSPKILKQAIERESLGRSVGQLQRGLSISTGGEGAGSAASLLKATYKDEDPEVAARVLQAIFDTYQNYVEGHSENVGAEAAELIAKAQLRNEMDLRKADEEYRNFVASVPALVNVSGSGVGTLEDVHRARLKSIEEELASVRRVLAETRSRRSVIAEAVDGKAPEEITDADVMTLLSDTEVTRLQALISIKKQRQPGSAGESESQAIARSSRQSAAQRLLELTSKRRVLVTAFGMGHPSVVALDAEIRAFEKIGELSDAEQAGGAGEKAFDVPPSEILGTYYAVLKSDLNEFARREAELLALSDQETKLAKQVELDFLKGASLKANLDRAQNRYDEVFKRLQELNLTNDYSGFSTDLLVMPVPASVPIWPSKSKIAMMGIMGGLMLGLGLAMLAELADRTFKDPGEVESVVGAPILAHMPMLRESKLQKRVIKGSAISPMVASFHLPRAVDSETFRVVRTSVLFLAKKQSKQVFLLTSPSPADGKSTMVSNLAVSMAQAGKRVLLVDADMRRPTIDKVFGVERSPGLSDYLNGVVSFSECQQDCEQLNLAVCPAGSRTSSPSELLESEQFAEFIAQARQSFDMVFIDSPPLLAVTDPAIITLHVDSCLLAVRIEKNSRTFVERAAEILRDHHVPIDGVIVNSRDSRRRGYGYSSYNYYGKGQYGYVDSYRRYYEAEEEDEPARVNGRSHKRINGQVAKVNGRTATSDRLISGKR
ncbi:Tyrosine-protein kinase wzc [Stieleria maiorica]|uniref:non-specific protein-tyrosine kinase n=1 Tax=Stieleria maiorica TaxID=2795974 RepID=A0A5B9MKP1_9BACT|nr:polysaccharide biosynthesis tyrosine autokinase [Stieleria maiorica]QEG01040.1 Tyrosine-protein kinase wzc [Stieleria maiorica]